MLLRSRYSSPGRRRRPAGRVRSSGAGISGRARPRGRGPEDAAVGLVDRDVVDAGLAAAHQPVVVELPQLVAVAAPPLARRRRGTRTGSARRSGCRRRPTGPCAARSRARAPTCAVRNSTISARPVTNSSRLRHTRVLGVGARRRARGSRVFQASSAAWTFWRAVSSVNGGNGGRELGQNTPAQLDPERSPQARPPGSGDPHGPAGLGASDPVQRAEPVEQPAAETAGQMVPLLGPVRAIPDEATVPGAPAGRGRRGRRCRHRSGCSRCRARIRRAGRDHAGGRRCRRRPPGDRGRAAPSSARPPVGRRGGRSRSGRRAAPGRECPAAATGSVGAARARRGSRSTVRRRDRRAGSSGSGHLSRRPASHPR